MQQQQFEMANIAQRLMEQKYQLHEDEREDEREDECDDNDDVENPSSKEDNSFNLLRALIGELLGVCFYVFIGCMATPHPMGVDPGLHHPGAGAMPVALSHGLGLAYLTMVLLKISGAHLNPAVTLGVALCGEIRLGVALAYVTTQIIGGIIGAAFCRAVLPKMVYIGINGGAHELHVGPGAAVACETILNVVVVLVYILSVLDPKTKSGRAPLGIGFAVLACTLASAGTTGGSVNVARSFGPAVAVSVYNGAVWKDHYVYWVGAVFGAVIAAVLYRTFLASDGKQLVTWRFAEEFFRKISRNNDQMTSLN